MGGEKEKPTEEQRQARRNLIKFLGAGVVGAAVGAGAMYYAAPRAMMPAAPVGEKPKERMKVPTSPLKMGVQTFRKGPGAATGESLYRAAVLAAEQINAEGGILGRKIQVIDRDEGSTDETVKEFKRMALEDKIDFYVGIISSGNTPAIGPVAEELGVLTLFVDGCTDFLFEKAVPRPRFTFRSTNIQSIDGITCAIAAVMKWPQVRKVAHIHPDYAYGRNARDHSSLVLEKSLPVQTVYEGFPKLFSTDFTPHITKIIDAKPDLLVTSLWGGDYITFYKQALAQGLFDKMKVATTLAYGMTPSLIGPDHPEGIIAGCHANYYFTYPKWDASPINRGFVEAYNKRWDGDYPNFEGEGAYVNIYLYKQAVEKASRLLGGWPSNDELVQFLEGASILGPAGALYIRRDNHQGYKNAVTGTAVKSTAYKGVVNIQTDQIHLPVDKLVAPPGWKGEPTAAYDWIQKTWPKMY